MKNKGSIIIIPYFGKLPSYFQFFLSSCKSNISFDWLIITDNDVTNYEIPQNVKLLKQSFWSFKQFLGRKFAGIELEIIRPHKLCDFKVAYGYIFEEEIKSYEYWGHGDLDVIYGNLNKFVNPLIEARYDKIFSLGHLSLYRNNYEINRVFMHKNIYKRVFSSDKAFAFDEWHCKFGGINHFFLDLEYKFYTFNHCANIDSGYHGFKLSNFIVSFHEYVTSKNHQQVFYYNKGNLVRHFLIRGKVSEKDYPYIHFHKREMESNTKNHFEYAIVPNKFIKLDKITKELICKHSKSKIIDSQWLKSKLINLFYRIQRFYRNV